MVTKEELAQLDLQYRAIANQRLMMEQRLAELKLAQDYLNEHKKDKVYKMVGPVLVELDYEEAKKEIEEEIKTAERGIEISKKKEEELKKKLETLVNEYLKGQQGGGGA